MLAAVDRNEAFGLDQTMLALAGLVVCASLVQAPQEIGLRNVSVSEWWRWFRLACLFACCLLGIGVILIPVALVLGQPIFPMRYPFSLNGLIFMCVYAPVTEEVTYRLLLTLACRPTLGTGGTILASGLLFAGVHINGGNPGLDNMVAGFLLEWVFLRSRSILVPIAMHAGGNALAFSVHVASWHLWH
ncbi:MAG: CPBP family intramembrane glutamic endopeptidase [Planctomycetales bacterium]